MRNVSPMPTTAANVQRDSRPCTYLGRCECGAIRFHASLDLAARDTRSRSVWERSVPASSFELQCGHESLIGLQFATENVHHFFCTRCKTRAFSHHAPEIDGGGYYSIDLKALELRSTPAPRAAP